MTIVGLQSTARTGRERDRMQRVTGCSTSCSGGQMALGSPSSEVGYCNPRQTSWQALEEGRHFMCSVSPYWEVAAALKLNIIKTQTPHPKFPFPGQVAHVLWGWGGRLESICLQLEMRGGSERVESGWIPPQRQAEDSERRVCWGCAVCAMARARRSPPSLTSPSHAQLSMSAEQPHPQERGGWVPGALPQSTQWCSSCSRSSGL